jgi:hypothetical protein
MQIKDFHTIGFALIALLFPFEVERLGATQMNTTNSVMEQLNQVRQSPQSAERQNLESRLLYYLAEETESKSEAAQLHLQGLHLAEQSLKRNENDPAALLWWSAHRGSQASPLRPLLAMRIAKEVEAALLRLKQTDPSYEYAAADRTLGYLYQVVPPIISIGSMKKAGASFQAALKQFPNFPGNQIYYANYLIEVDRCSEARKIAHSVLNSPELKNFALEAKKWVSMAQNILKRSEGKCT